MLGAAVRIRSGRSILSSPLYAAMFVEVWLGHDMYRPRAHELKRRERVGTPADCEERTARTPKDASING
jgi:hypothetical protein